MLSKKGMHGKVERQESRKIKEINKINNYIG